MIYTLNQAIRQVMPAAVATGLFVSLCTIQAPDGGLSPDGSPDQGFTTVLTDIPCMAAPESEARIEATEMKALAEIMSAAPLHVLLNKRYPQVEDGVASGWRAIIDGVVYDILGAESDSQGQMTRMTVTSVGL